MGLLGRRSQARAETGELDLRSEPTLDLRDGGPGRPGPCPRCGSRGYLDQIRARAGVQNEHCQRCECRWKRILTGDESGRIQIIDDA